MELHFPRTPPGEGVVNRSPLWGGQMEKLLLDAQRDPALSSSTRSSTPGPGRWSAASSRGASSRGRSVPSVYIVIIGVVPTYVLQYVGNSMETGSRYSRHLRCVSSQFDSENLIEIENVLLHTPIIIIHLSFSLT